MTTPACALARRARLGRRQAVDDGVDMAGLMPVSSTPVHLGHSDVQDHEAWVPPAALSARPTGHLLPPPRSRDGAVQVAAQQVPETGRTALRQGSTLRAPRAAVGDGGTADRRLLPEVRIDLPVGCPYPPVHDDDERPHLALVARGPSGGSDEPIAVT